MSRKISTSKKLDNEIKGLIEQAKWDGIPIKVISALLLAASYMADEPTK